MSDVFLSYSRTDRAQARTILDALVALDLDVFFDIEQGVNAGEVFPQRIADEVIGAKCVVACWSPDALTSQWCRRECFLALEQQKLVPAALRNVAATDLREFVDVSYEDLTDYHGQQQHFGWSQVLRAIASCLDSWADRNSADASVDAVLQSSAKIRLAAIRSRPTTLPVSTPATARTELWNKLKVTDDIGRLRRFAESYPNSIEAFEARDLAAAWEAYNGDRFGGLRREFENYGYKGSVIDCIRTDELGFADAVAEGESALRRDEKSSLADLTCIRAVTIRQEYLEGALAGISWIDDPLCRLAERCADFAAAWPNHPVVPEMNKFRESLPDYLEGGQAIKSELTSRTTFLRDWRLAHFRREYSQDYEDDEDEEVESEQVLDVQEATSVFDLTDADEETNELLSEFDGRYVGGGDYDVGRKEYPRGLETAKARFDRADAALVKLLSDRKTAAAKRADGCDEVEFDEYADSEIDEVERQELAPDFSELSSTKSAERSGGLDSIGIWVLSCIAIAVILLILNSVSS